MDAPVGEQHVASARVLAGGVDQMRAIHPTARGAVGAAGIPGILRRGRRDVLASSAPGGRVAKVLVVCDSSLHPHTRQTEASAVGRIRLYIKSGVALERIWHLSIVVSADWPARFTAEAAHSGHDSGAQPRRARIDGSMPTNQWASVESDRDRMSAI
jgi:hypothetical protein